VDLKAECDQLNLAQVVIVMLDNAEERRSKQPFVYFIFHWSHV